MSYNGSGTHSLPEAEFVAGAVIDQDAVNNNFSDISAALSTAICKDGQTTITADLPMATYKHTGVGNATARTNYAAAGQVQDSSLVWCGTAGGTANAITLTPTPAITAYAAGQRFAFLAAADNTAATTVAISGLTAKSIFVEGRAVVGGEIRTGRAYDILYDGTQFHATLIGAAQRGDRRNLFVNPHFTIAQNGTSIAYTAGNFGYTLDQVYATADATQTMTITQQAMTPGETTLPHEQPYFLRSASVEHGELAFMAEDVRTAAGKVVTFTFWAKSSSAGATVTPTLVQYFGVGGSANVTTSFDGAKTLTTSWAKYTQTVLCPSISGKTIGTGGHRIQVVCALEGDNLNIDFAYIQLEIGSSYSYIEPRSMAEEYELCHRYFQRTYANGTATAAATGVGCVNTVAYDATFLTQAHVELPVIMRAAPTVTAYSTTTGTAARLRDTTGGADRVATIDEVNEKGFNVYGAAMTVGGRIQFHWVADARM